ncbi:hypothetical protein JDV02_005445 [Purpureocillium takamizusanense]|uniref:Uncharacterized protein n=1 Tax=Purpureocillium takamizusanense TaxID=2060973 RepID=A0A9Q8VBU9_9HYPO|nr:uncharacterized protein JDV02_005445 [Purpureocillium takamizusanense]UNI19249.1 hypothetical protein JDV02_005445 [Purpureocillium takamizusanense]
MTISYSRFSPPVHPSLLKYISSRPVPARLSFPCCCQQPRVLPCCSPLSLSPSPSQATYVIAFLVDYQPPPPPTPAPAPCPPAQPTASPLSRGYRARTHVNDAFLTKSTTA